MHVAWQTGCCCCLVVGLCCQVQAPARSVPKLPADGADRLHVERLHLCRVELQQASSPSVQGISCTDSRPEVRNSGVRTLFSVVVIQGSKMSASMWDDCMWEILFPLLRSVHHMSVTSSREEVSCCCCLLSKVLTGHSTDLMWAACLARQQQPLPREGSTSHVTSAAPHSQVVSSMHILCAGAGRVCMKPHPGSCAGGP